MSWWAIELLVYAGGATVVAVRRWPASNVSYRWKGDKPTPPRTFRGKMLRVVDAAWVGLTWPLQAIVVLWHDL